VFLLLLLLISSAWLKVRSPVLAADIGSPMEVSVAEMEIVAEICTQNLQVFRVNILPQAAAARASDAGMFMTEAPKIAF
jgi:hypothetical protein